MQLQCPVCQDRLSTQPGQLTCAAGHSFDAARQGYYNLLLVQKKRSRDPGDNQAMVQARRLFLDRGYYQPLSDAINLLTADILADQPEPQVLDVGCGEGYYTQRLAQYFATAQRPLALAGLDISKHAIKAACQRSREIQWLVASAVDIPIAPHSLDLALLLFSRILPDALARPLKPGGNLLVAWPGANHLRQLRELIYDEVHDSVLDAASLLESTFETRAINPVQAEFTLQGSEAISELLAMTPHGQRLKPEARQRLMERDTLQLTLDVNLGWFQRR
ncbi:putative RNA methyltransferase [Pontibacter sp. JAM-7]|uniref:putative RNA methyltransferase n=1 Tax=Pontibacter sp. JAM-7 TaxID=3366581 RepID=UPI003AF90B2C